MERFCYLDLAPDELTAILSDEKLSQELTEYDKSSALTHVDELVNLAEDPTQVIVLNDEAVKREREYWTVEIPDKLSDSIKTFLAHSRA